MSTPQHSARRRLPRARCDEILDDFFQGRRSSFRECYIELTGDRRVTGRIPNINFDRIAVMTGFREAVDTSTFSNILGDAVHRNMVDFYAKQESNAAVWKKIVKPESVTDFRTRHITRFGQYASPLPSVAEGAPYPALTTPTDEEATYALEKVGGTESITLEAISKDDSGVIREIPKRLALAAHRTMASLVLDVLRTNPTIYDGVPLFHASHGNLGSAALSAVAIGAGWYAMQKQTDLGSNHRLGITPKYILVPYELEETAFNALIRDTNNDRTFIQSRNLEVVPVYDWTDANDWVLAADPMVAPCIEAGFYNGQQEPELFIQDVPTAGSIFSNDQTVMKVRHIRNAQVFDYRGLYKSVVA
ncbi:MAG: hypothetical protein GC151_13685 [Betaproteobacteria bacterium]|nr:hypothetical protein [Betaproteobacteria bacterium]